jgi:hypothetical protein
MPGPTDGIYAFTGAMINGGGNPPQEAVRRESERPEAAGAK